MYVGPMEPRKRKSKHQRKSKHPNASKKRALKAEKEERNRKIKEQVTHFSSV